MSQYLCVRCGNPVSALRWERAGMHTCLPCGDVAAKQARQSWTVCPIPKSNYILITDHTLLQGLNSSHRGNR